MLKEASIEVRVRAAEMLKEAGVAVPLVELEKIASIGRMAALAGGAAGTVGLGVWGGNKIKSTAGQGTGIGSVLAKRIKGIGTKATAATR